MTDTGEIGLLDTRTLSTRASGHFPGARGLFSIDREQTLLVFDDQLLLVRQSGRKLNVTAAVSLESTVQQLRRHGNLDVLCLLNDGQLFLVTIDGDSLQISGQTQAAPASFAYLIFGTSVGTLDDLGTLKLGLRRPLETGARPDVWSLSEDGHFAAYTALTRQLSIWDTVESEFTIGLDDRRVFPDSVEHLAWFEPRPDLSVLAVQHGANISVISKARRKYFDDSTSWAVLASISLLQCVALKSNGPFHLLVSHSLRLQVHAVACFCTDMDSVGRLAGRGCRLAFSDQRNRAQCHCRKSRRTDGTFAALSPASFAANIASRQGRRGGASLALYLSGHRSAAFIVFLARTSHRYRMVHIWSA